ncbi:alkaline phosphatase PhoX [Micromonospora sp. NPDC023644]|uniref:PhoX family protein n=1 Tax=Micromonospora sp. NPDC023644 TaxID=3154321 RepID=UPI003404D11A
MPDSQEIRPPLSSAVSRRSTLIGLASAAAWLIVPTTATAAPSRLPGRPLLGFRPVPISDANSAAVPAGYRIRVAGRTEVGANPATVQLPEIVTPDRTPVTFSGPARATDPELRSGPRVTALLDAASIRPTPWGTYLACERDFGAYFGVRDTRWRPTETDLRYGLGQALRPRPANELDPRFDLAAHPTEPYRYGWVVELSVDPDGTALRPVKRTALGRFDHVGVTVTVADGRVVVYSGDQEDGGYLYKYVGAHDWQHERGRGRSPLDHGVLHVASFADDGAGRWLPLTHGQGPLTVENGWRDQADVLLRARMAADALGATALDHPRHVAVDPTDGTAYAAMAGGGGDVRCRPDADAGRPGRALPRHPNPYGLILRWHEDGNGASATSFRWSLLVSGGDPARDRSVQLDATNMFGRPSGLSVDPDGRLWIQAGGATGDQGRSASVHRGFGNDAILAADPASGEIRRFFTAPRNREITRAVVAADQRSMFVTVRAPRGTPATRKSRSSQVTFVVTRRDGGVIGAS